MWLAVVILKFKNRKKIERRLVISKFSSDIIGNANGAEEISKLFYDKYRLLYNSVPTSDEELRYLRDAIN